MSASVDYTSFDEYGLRHLAAHLGKAGRSRRVCCLVLDGNWYAAKSQHDPSQWGYLTDLDTAFAEAVRQGRLGWPHLAANSMIRASLTATANYLPFEAYEALVWLDRGHEAMQRARMIVDAERKREALNRIRNSAHELTKTDLATEAEEEMSSLPLPEASDESKDDDWLMDFVAQFGTERALQTRLQKQVAPDPDRSKAAESHLEIAEAAIALGRYKEARELLLDCLDLLGETWEHDRQRLVTQIASLLFEMGYEADLGHLIDLAQNIELEHYRVLTVSDLALICSNASDSALAKRSLEVAVKEIRSAERRSTLQFEMSKVALAMSRLGNHRAGKWLGEAIELAGRPTQPAWRWQEKEAWVRVAGSLGSVGLCKEAVDLARQIGPEEFTEERIVVELVLQDRWDDAWQLAQDMPPIVRKRGLIAVARILAQRNGLERAQYRAIVAEIEKNLSSNSRPVDQIKALGQLIDIALFLPDQREAQVYLSQMMNIVDEVDTRARAEAIGDAVRCAVRLADVEVVRRLSRLALDLPDDERYHSDSNAIANVARALAELGEIKDAWSLSQDVTQDWKRVETYVHICELAGQQGQSVKELFARTLAFARRVNNVGFVPSYWGRLAVLSHHLGRQGDVEECISWAIAGVYAVDPSHEIGFNVINSGNVAQSLYELGLSDAAEEMLKFGVDRSHRALQSTEVLLMLAQALVKIGTESLWSNLIESAQTLEDPVQRVQTLLGIIERVSRSGKPSLGREILPLALDSIRDTGGDSYSLLRFGALLGEVFEGESKFLNDLAVDIFQHVRLKDRPGTLTAIAALVPAFAKVDSTVPKAIWNSVEQTEDLLNGWRS